MYSGIYEKIRHPRQLEKCSCGDDQILSVDSRLIYSPSSYCSCWAEEQDLLLRFGETYAEYLGGLGPFGQKGGNEHAC